MISLEGKTKILVIDENDCHTMNEVEEERKIDYINRKEAGKISFKDEVAIDTEHFTVLSSNDEKTILVAKSNLYVGEIWNMNYSTRVWTKTKTLTPEDEGYGLQNVDARGYVTGSYVNIGSVPFSASNYWDIDECHCGSSGLTCSSTNDSGFNNQHGLKPEYEVTGGYRTLKANVYNSSMSTAAPSFEGTCTPNNGYTIAYYVEAYVRKLKEMGAPTSITGRLLTNDEALVYLDGGLSGASYWTQTARGYYAMIVVFARYGRDLNLYPYFYGRSNYGVRVVLEVPTSTLS